MDIEIRTTSKKLTKSLISQFREASLDVMNNGEILGFLLNCHPTSSKILIVKRLEDYYVIHTNYVKSKGGLSVYRKLPSNFSMEKKFNSEEECTAWWNVYEEVIKRLHQQIYI